MLDTISPDEWELIEGYRAKSPPEKTALLTLVGRAHVQGTAGRVQGRGQIIAALPYPGQERRTG